MANNGPPSSRSFPELLGRRDVVKVLSRLSSRPSPPPHRSIFLVLYTLPHFSQLVVSRATRNYKQSGNYCCRSECTATNKRTKGGASELAISDSPTWCMSRSRVHRHTRVYIFTVHIRILSTYRFRIFFFWKMNCHQAGMCIRTRFRIPGGIEITIR